MSSYLTDHGYLDGIVRGYYTQLMNSSDYANLTQCETVDDMKVHLLNSDYGTVFQDVPSPLTAQSVADACTAKMVEEFHYIRSNAYEPLTKFMDYITYGYMIDNIILILGETTRDGDPQTALAKCHPLGVFEGLTALCVAQSTEELYNLALINTPLSKYFISCLTVEDFDEVHIEVIRNLLYKEYLTDFYKYSKTLGDDTFEVMGELLRFEADRRSINITVNSWGTTLNKDERKRLYPSLGELWPEGTQRLQAADDMEAVAAAVDHVDEYRGMLQNLQENPSRTLEDEFIEHEMKLNRLAVQRQMQYGAFYAYFRLKEQEIRNIVWIAECIAQKKKDRIQQFVMF
ncbi:putative V-type proton ATPase subunit D [Monocercomonoides exilis]|uniref:putative V-type proton ATPase subunit D n=1 Tax=Monocercomonoides exilis TaxID=2049356 RepID=UPI003559472E|nr:putative V-type proton ATPase subunit D [Monocercomonoides exilis]|eukprot:MONOS_14814.1-p1 / transcript=MONOS_14814.1 / gene=MONOS_14814 / organism=Monocercomonoides_exilis_PA203 / gene_product=V-type proton ATPase subunit D / transcript_product=V-type proton ATPase subunit D / location=Mono_scaffold01078:9985-11090(-) / protein_length=344 / sequence_SO=supercontig / SO=protein_coding / is_pseudo=false